MASNLRQRAVVSSFICTPPDSPGGFRFALFKRSDKVRTYPGKWAVCSGSIDPTDESPEEAAKREIQEETTLSDADIFLLRRGKPFSLVDQDLNTEWTIHPFAWQLRDSDKTLTIDWEHSEYRFIKPDELASVDHVPQLEIGLWRSLVSPGTEKGLAILQNDHESGAQALALKALNLLLEYVQGGELANLSTSREFWKELRWRAWHLAKNGRPSMGAAIEAALFRPLERVRAEVDASAEGIDSFSLSTLKSAVESAITAKIEAKKHSLENLAAHFVHLVNENVSGKQAIKVVTLSSSGTITRSLSQMIEDLTEKGLNINISVLESRPKFEGAAFVSNLLSSLENNSTAIKNLKVEMFSDASVATVIPDADYFVFGGDKVLPNGNVSNKIGSLTAAIVTKALNPNCQIVALVETDKITGSGFDSGHAKVEYNDEAEVMDSWPAAITNTLKDQRKQGYSIEVKNAYFEWVSATYIDHYISEQGPLKQEDINKLGSESQELEKRIFEDL